MSYAAARHAVGPLQAPLSQWILVLGGFCYLSDPEKFSKALQTGARAFLVTDSSSPSTGPIVIHSSSPSSNSKSLQGTIIQLALSAGVCWGGYVLLITILPEAAKGLLPVTTAVFQKAVASLGKGLIAVKETLSKQLMDLTKKQDETHSQVVEVKHSVEEVADNVESVQLTLDKCQEALDENERRTHYIARGVRLLSKGVSTILPHDADLIYELDQFQKSGMDFTTTTSSPAATRPVVRQSTSPTPPASSRRSAHHTPVAYPVASSMEEVSSSKMQQQQPRIQVQPVVEDPVADVQALLASVGH